MPLQDKLLLTRYELSIYLLKERFPVYVVTDKNIIKYKIEYYKNNKVRIFNFQTELEKSSELSELYTADNIIGLNDKIYTVKGITSYLDKLDKK